MRVLLGSMNDAHLGQPEARVLPQPGLNFGGQRKEAWPSQFKSCVRLLIKTHEL